MNPLRQPAFLRRPRTAFTLVELLIVIAIIAILAALSMTVLVRVKIKEQKTRASLQERAIVNAISEYLSLYSHFPVSPTAQNQATQYAQSGFNPDFTYGGLFNTPNNPPPNAPTQPVGTPVGSPSGSPISNAEVIAILMNFTKYPNGGLTVNTNSQKNPAGTRFLQASMSGDTSSPGVGQDLVYRDPWGNPYVITMDLNGDEACEDAFYSTRPVSNGGLNGLVLQPDGNWGLHRKVMVWSAGPDRMVDPGSPANTSANKDNVISW